MAWREYEIEIDSRYYQVGASIEAWSADALRINVEEVIELAEDGTELDHRPPDPELTEKFKHMIRENLDSQDVVDILREDYEAMRERAEEG